jgi:hypothetical protein
MKPSIFIFLVSALLAGGLFLNRELNKPHSIKTYSINPQDRTKATLIWRLDKEGSLWQKINLSDSSWQRIWPDQLMMIIQDEKSLHKEKALTLIEVDSNCSFDCVWKLLQLCLDQNLTTSLNGSADAQ